MAGGLLYALAGLGQGAKGLPEGMIAGQKLDQSQQQLDALTRHQKALEDAQTTDVGQLFSAIGLPAPAGLTGRVPNAVATAAATTATKNQERQRLLSENAGLANDLTQLGQGTPPTPASTQEPGLYNPGTPGDPRAAGMAPLVRRYGVQAAPLFKELYPEPKQPQLVGENTMGVLTPGKGYEALPRPAQTPFTPPEGYQSTYAQDRHGNVSTTFKPAPKDTTDDKKRAEIESYLTNVRGLTPGTPQFQKEYMDWRNRPLTIFPGGGAFQATDVIGAPGGSPQPIATREPTPPVIGPQESTNLADFRTLLGQMTKAKAAYEGGGKQYVGPVAGRLGALKGITGIGASQPEAELRATLASVQNSLIYLKSGKQINEQEYQRLSRELPDPSDPAPVFEAKMTQAMALAQTLLANREAEFKSRGYRGEAPAPAAPGGVVGAPAGPWNLRETATGRVRRYQPGPGETQPPAGYERVP